MSTEVQGNDYLFQIAEDLSQDFSLFPQTTANATDAMSDALDGIVSEEEINATIDRLKSMSVDEYIETVVAPTKQAKRKGSSALVRDVASKIISEVKDGPLYAAEVEMNFHGKVRRIGFICQERSSNNGSWMPEHHIHAGEIAKEFADRSLPIVTFMDTPGADAGEVANRNNQGHSISRLITEMSILPVPTVGIVTGAGYSGGAIPLAATNILLSLKDGIFNTIQPEGLASIARKLKLSWQECAQLVGVSAFELYQQGNIDGIINYSPVDNKTQIMSLIKAIVSSIESIEATAKTFVKEHPYIVDHYVRSMHRYLEPTDKLQKMMSTSGVTLATSPTDFLNIFGLTYRYTRYLVMRKRIKTQSLESYGRLAKSDEPVVPKAVAQAQAQDTNFRQWLYDADKVVYEDSLLKGWKNYTSKLEDLDADRGSIATMIFGNPKENYQEAKEEMSFKIGLYLFNRWKKDATVYFAKLVEYIKDDNRVVLLRQSDIKDALGLAELIQSQQDDVCGYIRAVMNYDVQKSLQEATKSNNVELANKVLTAELNRILLEQPTTDKLDIDYKLTRALVEKSLTPHVELRTQAVAEISANEVTLMDIVQDSEFKELFIETAENMQIFGELYNGILANLPSIAKEANESRGISKLSVEKMLDTALTAVFKGDAVEEKADRFKTWLMTFIKSSARSKFLEQVEEWKQSEHPRVATALFVVITFYFEKLLPAYYESVTEDKDYDGTINPRRIGRVKDFWNRLSIAYCDLQIAEIFDEVKARKTVTPASLVSEFFTNYEEYYGDLMTNDPVGFPGFRQGIEKALDKGVKPCGLETGIGTLNLNGQERQVGVVMSNLAFQAGAFDMASAEKFCRLLVEAAKLRIPVVAFISSGGMQTKEGAGSLFGMPVVNDRITRFVRDNDLPVVVFGFGDCTGGAQASFVTHPMVSTYYFSGTNMPFAGQVVVPSYLPTTSTLSNYLYQVPGAMKGLVKHPFEAELDGKLREVDPRISVPLHSISEVLAAELSGTPLSDIEPEEKISKIIEPVKRVLVHARGCTADKLVRIAQKNNIEVVLVQSDPDMNSVAADRLGDKDQLVCLGGNTSDESYLNALSVISIAEHEKCDALHPGIGFLSENAQFAELCDLHGINFVGPSVNSMRAMGNKSNAINTCIDIGVPVVPGSHGILANSEEAAKVADKIGYPVLLKAVHGGGGKGIQVVESPDQIHELFNLISSEALAAFGNSDIYLEKYVTSLRHIEVQVLRDSQGVTKVLGLRDCSVQRNKQKVVEESGSTMLPADLEKQVYDYAAKISDAVNYIGAGTVEFIFDLPNNAVYFMEMNTRLQVEHPVTEKVSGVDIVSRQFEIASGKSIADIKPKQNGYSIEVRVTAEKATVSNGIIDFTPTPGDITKFELPEDKNIDLIKAVDSDKAVSPYYDSMILQVICHGKDRNDTVKKLIKYLKQVTIEGVCTNIPLLIKILEDKVFVDGVYDTNYLPELLDRIDTEALSKEIEEASGSASQLISLDDLRIDGSDEIKVLSPSTSIFYRSSSPTEPTYVEEGDVVNLEQTLCVMEAMKVFTPLSLNSINRAAGELFTGEVRYQVTRIHNQDGQQVNKGDLLFVIKPIAA